MSGSLTYVYCLVRSGTRPSVRAVPAGMPGGGVVRVLEIPRRAPVSPTRSSLGSHEWLIVSSVSERAYGGATLDRKLQQMDWIAPRALAHEAVIESFLGADAVLPMQLFTLFTSDARAIEHVTQDRRRIARILSRVSGHVEWGVRLTWQPAAADTRRGGAARTRRASSSASGVEYLRRKRDLRDETRANVKRAQNAANRAYRAVARDATRARRRTDLERAPSGSRLLLDAAFLVPAGRSRAFQNAARRATRPLERDGVVVSVTGPWPAYNFI